MESNFKKYKVKETIEEAVVLSLVCAFASFLLDVGQRLMSKYDTIYKVEVIIKNDYDKI